MVKQTATPESVKKIGMVSPMSTKESGGEGTETPLSPLKTPGSSVTSWTDDDVMRFLIYGVLNLKKEKDDNGSKMEAPIYRALIENEVTSPKIWRNLHDITVAGLEYLDKKKKKVTLMAGQ